MNEVKRLFGLFDGEEPHQAGSVYDTEGLSPNIDTAQGGYRQPLVIDSDVVVGGSQEHSTVRFDGICPTLVGQMGTGGNNVPITSEEPVLVGGFGEMKSNNGTQYYQQDRIYSADAVALCQSANENFNPWYAVASKKRGDEHKIEESDREQANAITSIQTDSMVGNRTRIRKLTPKECWRLMGFDDEDFDRAKEVNSDTQLYKQAGNSIVVDVLEAIFKEML